jgi:5'-methylthioadenosine phosphorylase
MVFLPRHGRGHRLLPHELNYRANVHGLLQLGVKWLISISAVGSMKEEICPGEMVIVDQFFDRTKARPCSFFGDGVAGHVSFADPVCVDLAQVLHASAVEAGATAHRGGTYVCIDGPQFSTRAESRIYRGWGVDVIGMTNIPEAKLAREAGMCYATVAMVTDYDCWHEDEEDVSVTNVLQTLHKNVDLARRIISMAVSALPPTSPTCRCASATTGAVMTAPEAMNPETRQRLSLILGKEAAR